MRIWRAAASQRRRYGSRQINELIGVTHGPCIVVCKMLDNFAVGAVFFFAIARASLNPLGGDSTRLQGMVGYKPCRAFCLPFERDLLVLTYASPGTALPVQTCRMCECQVDGASLEAVQMLAQPLF